MKHFNPKIDQNLEDLLRDFFNFYSSFPFEDKAISLKTGKLIGKPVECPMYIVNPLEENLNVSHNVSIAEVERLRIEMRESSWIFESEKPELMNIFRIGKPFKTKKNQNVLDVSRLFGSEKIKNNSQVARTKVL